MWQCIWHLLFSLLWLVLRWVLSTGIVIGVFVCVILCASVRCLKSWLLKWSKSLLLGTSPPLFLPSSFQLQQPIMSQVIIRMLVSLSFKWKFPFDIHPFEREIWKKVDCSRKVVAHGHVKRSWRSFWKTQNHLKCEEAQCRSILKTLPEAQRTQGIASKTWVFSPAK